MRKLLMITAMVAVALGGTAACANKPASPSSSPSTAATAADETKAVCAEAKTASDSATTTLKAKLAEGTQAFLAGDQAKALKAQTEAKAAAVTWTAKLTELSSKPIKPEVKKVLTDGVAMITSLSATLGTSTSTADAEAKLNDFTTKLAAACA
jgi:hypothetical protein